MENTERLQRWAIDKIEREYPDDIALLVAVNGHETDNDGHGRAFDYFIPETERGNELAQTFIIDGIGYDLYPRSWERMEKSADLDEIVFVLANAKILYARSKEAVKKFQALQKKLDDNLHNPVFVYRKALERVEGAMELYRTLLFEEKFYRARTQARYIHLYLSQAVAYLNNTFAEVPIFTKKQAYGGDGQYNIYHCPGLASVPDLFFKNACRLLEAGNVEELAGILHLLICETRKFVLARGPEQKERDENAGEVYYQGLADWYQELRLTWRRLDYFCRENMVEEAYSEACFLQGELIAVAGEFQIEEMNLMEAFSAHELKGLSARSVELEERIRRILKEHHITIREYASCEDFLAAETEKGQAGHDREKAAF